eukprot:SAG22_NODE_2751_length_2250_cov_31.785681_1_plen_237_part_00
MSKIAPMSQTLASQYCGMCGAQCVADCESCPSCGAPIGGVSQAHASVNPDPSPAPAAASGAYTPSNPITLTAPAGSGPTPPTMIPSGGVAAAGFKPLTEMSAVPTVEPWGSDGALNTQYFTKTVVDSEEPNALKRIGKQLGSIKASLPGHHHPPPDYENVIFKTENTTGDVYGMVQRMAASDAEVENVAAAVVDSYELGNCLGPNEQVLAAIPCHVSTALFGKQTASSIPGGLIAA